MFYKIMKELGYSVSANDGAYRWEEVKPSAKLIKAIETLPQTESEFLTVDLDTMDIAATDLDNLKKFQCGKIRELRAEAYKAESDPLYMAVVGDHDSEAPWVTARVAIKNRYPWPGAYR